MRTVLSKDGTRIAYEQTGSGPAVVLVGGAFSYRGYPGLIKLADKLSERYTVINYDRRGRGDSADSAAYAVEREIEDLQALIEVAGGSAHVYGVSSGGVLALRASAAGLPINKVAVYQPSFVLDETGKKPPVDFSSKLNAMVGADHRGDAVKYFMTKGMGAPSFFVNVMRVMPVWKRLKAVANTLPYDYAVMGDTMDGKPLGADPWSRVAAPTLVLDGGKSPATFKKSADALAVALPHGKRLTLEGQSFDVSVATLAPALGEFFG